MVQETGSKKITEDYITERLFNAIGKSPEEAYPSALLSDAPKPAAVLVPLLKKSWNDDKDRSWHVLLTRRSDSLIEHRGQVAYPGGRSDKDDPSPEATALREAQEEIGIKPGDVRLLGKLTSVLTISNYSVTPVVGVIPWPYEFKLASYEVSRVFSIPLDWLADSSNYEIRQREIPSPYSQIMRSNKHPVIYFNTFSGEKLWGVSAEITLRLIRTIYE
jgi:8-oxo-dGTP pyrophosphatase MutT (NUDIX family)